MSERLLDREVHDYHMAEWSLVGVSILFVRAKDSGRISGGYIGWCNERRRWCAENCQGSFAVDTRRMVIFMFDHHRDAVAFRMRWS